MTNTNLLEQKIKESGYRIHFIAQKLGISYQALRNKITNSSQFSVPEMLLLCDLLKISDDLRGAIFFAESVDKTATNETVSD